ncbi:MAG: murein hydrolase activator EnvC family protein [Geminicoccaceae bacterium]
MLASFALIAPLMLITLLSTSPAFSAVDHDTILRDRLSSVRELLDRRHANRTMLNSKIERFASNLDRLQMERESALSALTDQQDRARMLEQELDKLMPRLLPRLDLLDQVRKDGARTISGLASIERNADLKDRTRARLMATKTASIEQMLRTSTAVRRLRRVPNALTARHRDVDFQIPLLAASVDRLELRQSQLQRQRDGAIRELADLTVDIERLTAEEHRLARNMIARSLEATDGADVSPDSLKAVLVNRRGLGKSVLGAADVRGIALRQTQPTPVARPLDGIGAEIGLAAATSRASNDIALSAKKQTSALLAGWASRKQPWAADVASPSPAATNDEIADRIDSVRLETTRALVPTVETIGYNLADEKPVDDHPAIEIAALPRQRVAAPDNGRVAFAGEFRSYGLLLIIEHGNGYHTLLWGFSSLDIGFGDAVRAGQIIGTVKDGPSPRLHVELRRNGQPVSPEVWLAASNSGVKG